MTTQLDCSIGLAKETVYGTGVAVAKFPEFLDESLAWNPTFVQGAGMRTGKRLARAARRSIAKEQSGGDINLEMCTKGLGVFLEALFGTGTSTAVPAQTGAYQQVFTPTTTDPVPSYTIQKGIPTVGGGAVTAMTFNGAVCASGEFSASAGEIVKLKTTWDAREVLTSVAYAPPSYAASPELFTFVHGSICIGGTVTPPTATALATGGTIAANITEFSFSWDNKIDDGGFTFGSKGKRGRKPVVGLAEGKGKVTAEYTNTILRDAYLAQQQLALLLTFETATVIGATARPSLQIYLPVIMLEGELPKSNGGAVITQSIDFTVLDGEVTASPVYVAMVTTDTAI
ncbi:hypothetical protein MB46_10395 [Arthrobacter alpinus]|uniref:phage tail tube protein n=1 Tax=Arthrobacter alpinus TaxID=656366 RepID=UPI0006787ADE|nr:phage tail tube protein [Arthrobacter alpinus]ALV45830.1 hypothetical protein MB46_10395 [Arthrobacter alpinus]